MERWRSVIGYEGLYEVSNRGRVRSLPRTRKGKAGKPVQVPARVLKTPPNKEGYVKVTLARDGVNKTLHMHRVVARAFKGPIPKGQEVRHKDGDPSHNEPDNLFFATHKRNIADKIVHGTHLIGSRRGYKTTPEQVRQIRLRAKRESIKRIAVEFDIDATSVRRIVSLETWSPYKYLDLIKRQIEYHQELSRPKTLKDLRFSMLEMKVVDPHKICYHEAVRLYQEFRDGYHKTRQLV